MFVFSERNEIPDMILTLIFPFVKVHVIVEHPFVNNEQKTNISGQSDQITMLLVVVGCCCDGCCCVVGVLWRKSHLSSDDISTWMTSLVTCCGDMV
jgi:hypothetical protein